METRIVKRNEILDSGRVVRRVYAVELYNDEMTDRITPYMITPESAVKYLMSTGSAYRNIEVKI